MNIYKTTKSKRESGRGGRLHKQLSLFENEPRDGTYNNKPINTFCIGESDVVQRFEYKDKPGVWFFPLIEDGENVDKEKFRFVE